MKRLTVLTGSIAVSLSPVFVRLSSAPSMILALYRVIWASVLMTPYILLRRREELFHLRRRELLLCICSGVFLGLQFAAYFESVKFTSIAVSSVLINTEALFVTVGAVIFLKNRMSAKAWAAVAIAFAGSVVVAMAGLSGGGSLKGNLLALAGAVIGSGHTLVGTVCRRGGISTTTFAYLDYVSAMVTVLVCAVLSGTPLSGYTSENIWTALGLAVACTLLGCSLYSWGLKYLPASFVASAKLTEPVFAAMWGLLLFRERPAALVVIGGIVVIGGFALYSHVTGEGDPESPPQAEEAEQAPAER